MNDNSTRPTNGATSHPILAPGVGEAPALAHTRDMFAVDRASAHLGITITELEFGHCVGHFTVRPEMCNGHGMAHGGFLYAFADSLFAGACNSPGHTAVAAQNSIHYLAPAQGGDRVDGVAVNREAWGRNGITDVTLSVNGKVIAEFRGTYRVIAPRQ